LFIHFCDIYYSASPISVASICHLLFFYIQLRLDMLSFPQDFLTSATRGQCVWKNRKTRCCEGARKTFWIKCHVVGV